ncbi:hypothetical protein BCR33DRAFT_714805 [Rhizoclosmatium globosum]|uniref:F-box domain-containing protein n=1 Tax=Rhizoclosmatium globosum TaxID=329046 RepID=A0A1Y2CL52_9FUNG|nr:hypothetical protein BCR33DRAFT_714805 [Rhizoclosmatium globosum]|eukprot:ORY47730.1 hypothetical protein BCR33DRAFT_714805 [Rhizoclosmatium globosum]
MNSPTVAGLPALPSELLIQIFAHLQPCDVTLVLTAVSNVWRQRLLPLAPLFTTQLVLPFDADLAKGNLRRFGRDVKVVLDQCPRASTKNVDKVTALLTAMTWVSEPKDTSYDLEFCLRGEQTFDATMKAVNQSTLSILENFTTLSLSKFLISPVSDIHLTSLAFISQRCSRLKSLSLDSPTRAEQSMSFLKLFPQIEHLSLSHASLGSIPPKIGTFLPQLRSLTLSNIAIKNVGNIRKLDSFPCLRNLHLRNLDARFIEDVDKLVLLFIAATGTTTTLHQFSLSLTDSSTKFLNLSTLGPRLVTWITRQFDPTAPIELTFGKCRVQSDLLIRISKGIREQMTSKLKDVVNTHTASGKRKRNELQIKSGSSINLESESDVKQSETLPRFKIVLERCEIDDVNLAKQVLGEYLAII